MDRDMTIARTARAALLAHSNLAAITRIWTLTAWWFLLPPSVLLSQQRTHDFAHCEHDFTVASDTKALNTRTPNLPRGLFRVQRVIPFISLALIWNINTSLQTIWSCQLSLLGTFHQFHHFYLQLVNCDTVSLAGVYSSLASDLNPENTIPVKHYDCHCTHFVH